MFKTEYVFTSKGGEPIAVAVKVNRPPLYLDDFISIWTSAEDGEPWSERLLEGYHHLKVYYIILQVLE